MNKINYDIEIDRSLIQTEEEMLARWGEFEKPLVSINCITYNHERYIRDALDGFLIQKTDFPFEILVHDDASTDRTADIIREYEKRYPNIIKPIYQTENQYSQGKKCSLFNFERAQGEYIAMCEGDDYWIDPLKLGIQISFMLKNPSIHISFHKTLEFNEADGDLKVVCAHKNHDSEISMKEAIEGRGGFMPTPSVIVANKNTDKLFDSFKNAPIGDFFLQSFFCLTGKIFYFDRLSSVYRREAKGSWTEKQNNKKIASKYACSMVQAIDNFFLHMKDYDGVKYLKKPLGYYFLSCCFSSANIRDVFGVFFQKISRIRNVSKIYLTYIFLKKFVVLGMRKIYYMWV